MSSIFVQIASYDDEELIKTINDCLNKSSKNHEIFFGVHECYINNKTNIDLKNVKIKYSKAPENIGVGMGRYLANQFYNNEDYYLQIDSHTRFIENWDEKSIFALNEFLNLGNKCILTSYPPGYKYVDEKEVLDDKSQPTLIKVRKDEKEYFYETRIIAQEGKYCDMPDCSDSVSAAFIFGKGDIHNVVQNPAIFYYGEEILRAASFYTNGYNLMSIDQPIVFHLYGVNSKRVPVWQIYKEESDKLEDFSKTAIKLILSENRVGPRELGSERSLKEFGRFIGVDFEKGCYL